MPRAGFTLVELVMGMMVSGMIVAAVATVAMVIGTYNGEGDAGVELATHGRFAARLLETDLRCAQVAEVSDTGGLVLWMGDANDNDRMDSSEYAVYYKPSRDRVMRRVTFDNSIPFGPVSPAQHQMIVDWYDAGTLESSAQAAGAQPRNEVVCRNVDGLAFYPNRPAPETLTVEYVLRLSRPGNRVSGTGRTIPLTLYGTGTMRVPYTEDGFDPKR